MKKITIALLLALPLLHAEIEFQDDFEKSTPAVGQPINRMTANDAKIEVVSAKKPEGANKALVIQGGTDEKHSWQPAGDIAITEGSNGYLYIAFSVKNSSFEPAQFGIQVSNKGEYTYKMWQRFHMYPNRIQISGTGRGLAKTEVSAGKDAKWTRIVWIFPLPGTENPEPPTLTVNGNDQGEIRNEPLSDTVEKINNVRFWLPSLRGEDTQFFVDDVLVITAPTREALEAEVKKAN